MRIGISRVGGISLLAWQVTPVLVHPEPALGVGADGFFKVIPYALGEHPRIILLTWANGLEDLHLITAIRRGLADAGDDGKSEPLGQLHMERRHAGLHAEALDHRRCAARFDVQIRQQSRVALTLQRFHQLQHRIVLRNDRVPGMLTQLFENGGEGSILEILCHDRERHASEAPDQTDELEIAEVRSHPDSPGLTRLCLSCGVIQANAHMFLPVFRSQGRGPEEVEKGAREVLI